VATVVYTIATIALWRQTRRQASLTREIFEATHRPHLALRVEVWGQDPIDQRTALQVRPSIKNHGGVPATVVAWQASVVEGTRPLGEQHEATGNLGLSVFPGREEMSKPLAIRDAQGQQDACNLSRQGQVPVLVLEARVEYRGAFATPYWTRARVEVHAHWMVTTQHDTEAVLAPAKVYRELYTAIAELRTQGTWPKSVADVGLLKSLAWIWPVHARLNQDPGRRRIGYFTFSMSLGFQVLAKNACFGP